MKFILKYSILKCKFSLEIFTAFLEQPHNQGLIVRRTKISFWCLLWTAQNPQNDKISTLQERKLST